MSQDLNASRDLGLAAGGVREPKRKRAPRRRPIEAHEGPWLIRSHYWGRWHRRSSDGGACGYTDDIAEAGVFDFAKARGYHDWETPNGRDEAIPVKRYVKQMTARLRQLEAEHAAFAAKMETLRAATAGPTGADLGPGRPPEPTKEQS